MQSERCAVCYDVAIVGGGLAGAALAVALADTRLTVALIDSTPPVASLGWDARVYAISPANVRFLAEIGLWHHLDHGRIVPVEAMRVYGDAGGRLDFTAWGVGVEALAWILEATPLQLALWRSARCQRRLTLISPARPVAVRFAAAAAHLDLDEGRSLAARLLVAADGRDSWLRQAAGIAVDFLDYDQLGVVANFRCARPHRHIAYQWFRADGILAYLPLPENMISIVWSTPTAHGRELLALAPQQFCARVARAGGHVLGELELVTPPAAFALKLMRAPRLIGHRLALIGDAAHAIHPLTGHGINLGFQDARELAYWLRVKPPHIDGGDIHWLRRYERARREEIILLQSVTHALQRLFAPSRRPLAAVRNLGLVLGHRLPLLRSLLARYAMG